MSRDRVAHGLELAGLTLTGLAFVQGLVTGDVGRELLLMVGGAGVFLAGWLIARRGGE